MLGLTTGQTLGLEWGAATPSANVGLKSTGAATLTGSGKVVLDLTGAFTSGTKRPCCRPPAGWEPPPATPSGNASNFTYTLTDSGTAVVITPTAVTALTTEYWHGGFAGPLGTNVWVDSNGSTASNWSSAATNSPTSLIPAAATNVIFSVTDSTNSGEGSITLGGPATANSITVNENYHPGGGHRRRRWIYPGARQHHLPRHHRRQRRAGHHQCPNYPRCRSNLPSCSNSTTGVGLTVGGAVTNNGNTLTLGGSGNSLITVESTAAAR